ncbi:Kunitz-type U15-theraphotoxin-Hs1a [Armadillidium vulgare]|nr:Kunitz-type U15-theraphotoxin-Hs1a [Armadillidium vulgare]
MTSLFKELKLLGETKFSLKELKLYKLHLLALYLWHILNRDTKTKVDVCQLPLEHGTCKNGFEVWGFDAKTGQCIKFNSCNNEGDKNNFFTEAECETLCESK